MASLLDIFGGDDEALRGLLGAQYQPSREQAQAQALFGLAKGLYAAGAPSRTPTSGIGAGIAQGIEAGQQAYRQALQTSMADKLQAAKVQELLKNQQAEALLGQSFVTPEQVTPAMQPTPQQIERGIVPQPTVTRGAPQFDVNRYIQGAVQLGVNPKTIMDNIKSMQGEAVKLGEGESLYRQNPMTGQLEPIAAGAPKATNKQKDYEAAVAQGFTGSFIDFIKAGTPSQTVNISENKFAGEFGTNIAKNVEATYNQAASAVNTIQKIKDIRPLLSAGVYEGPLSKQVKLGVRIADTLGVSGANEQEKLANTAVAMQGLAGLELDAAGQMKGQGQITENERSLIKRAAAGDLESMTASEVNSLLNAMEKTSNYRINVHKKNYERLSKNPQTKALAEYYNLEENMPAQKPSAPSMNLDMDSVAAAARAEKLRRQGR